MKIPCFVAAMLLSCASTVHAQDFPTRPITILVGVSPGGVTDLATRAYANSISKNTGWKVVVENRTGAGGAVAAKAVESAAPDGYTLLTVVGAQLASIPAMQNPPPFDPIRGFQPISLTFRLAQLLAVPADSPANTLSELLALAKKKDGGLSFGTPGAGSPAHLLGAKIALATGTPMQYVHYRGGPPMIADLVTGRLDFGLLSYIAAKPHMDDKKLKGLVIDSEARLEQIPNVPTLIDAGLAKERVANWFGVAAPAGTPADIVRKLNAEFARASKDPDVIRQLEASGAQVATSTPEEMTRLVVEEVASMKSLISALGLKKE
ncbi:tripartite tricarboxylate transporter substrate binding protein [Pseudorhodoplanes sp.]|uniref:Bug family tripartite tricarboxylate transporter substrate binding protein n=1 Tax=Pseudorhodoplanes sp. TaxID=1934341 RepID=UPI002BD6F7A4|nr:tripartite tricarboxylate transporter substrate binding protein [Pseudorhodoplanes sp.]HWV52290.1 tripartite tricarboxylate transporter substrate binding protein [Pseudorhodoplanes sp.]